MGAQSTRKRKLESEQSQDDASPPPKRTPKTKQPPGEKRLRRFRPKAPRSFEDIYARATSQRFYVLTRTRTGTESCPEEMVELTGSTGNIYSVHIGLQPRCNCPHGEEGNQCKHWLYVMTRVLRAKFEHVYQLALLSTELQEIFAAAPPIANDHATKKSGSAGSENRKAVDGDCPICFEELQEAGEAIVWCKAMCGQNIHKGCFEMWAATKRQAAGGGKVEVTCPYCRTAWQGDEDMVQKIKKTGKPNYEGYVNVAKQLGISTVRDTSTYSPWGGYNEMRSYGRGYDRYGGGYDGYGGGYNRRRW